MASTECQWIQSAGTRAVPKIVTYGTCPAEAGVDIKTVQCLDRHKRPVAAMEFYARARHGGLRPALKSIPLSLGAGHHAPESGILETLESIQPGR